MLWAVNSNSHQIASTRWESEVVDALMMLKYNKTGAVCLQLSCLNLLTKGVVARRSWWPRCSLAMHFVLTLMSAAPALPHWNLDLGPGLLITHTVMILIIIKQIFETFRTDCYNNKIVPCTYTRQVQWFTLNLICWLQANGWFTVSVWFAWWLEVAYYLHSTCLFLLGLD